MLNWTLGAQEVEIGIWVGDKRHVGEIVDRLEIAHCAS